MTTELPQSPVPRSERFHHSWRHGLRISSIRIVTQAVTFALFVGFVILTSLAQLERTPALRHWVSKFLDIDPLVALATAISTHTVYRGLLWSLLIVIPTFFLGRFFCNWMCPLGSLHHFVGWLPGARRRGLGLPHEVNYYSTRQRIKYAIAIALLVAAVFGSLQIGLLDPICLVYRSISTAVWSTLGIGVPTVFGDPRLHQGAWLIGALFAGFLLLNITHPRFFCRILCPLGALLGILSRWAWWRIERNPDTCTGCNRCLLHCEGACDPHLKLRKAECLVCFNCIEECPEGALRFAFLPRREDDVAGPDLARRKLVLAGAAGALFHPLVRATGRVTRDFASAAIRPPGAVEELKFLERCVKCAQCIRVCPTNVLQPAWFEAGLEGLWTPVLNFRIGYCQHQCVACGHVCPTGAIERISPARKLGLAESAAAGPIRLGTAHLDVNRCLPYSAGVPCRVCEEVCPTSPKAIRAVRWAPPALADAKNVDTELLVPVVDIDLCTGCGICEYACPVVGDRRAIYVTAEGESRSRSHPAPDRNRAVRLSLPR